MRLLQLRPFCVALIFCFFAIPAQGQVCSLGSSGCVTCTQGSANCICVPGAAGTDLICTTVCRPTDPGCLPPPPPSDTCSVSSSTCVCTLSATGAGTICHPIPGCDPTVSACTSPSSTVDDTTISNANTPEASPSDAQSCAGQPVVISSGAMFHRLTDFNVAARTAATSLLFQRTYLAMPTLKLGGDFGVNWAHNWETKLMVQASVVTPNALDNLCASPGVTCSPYFGEVQTGTCRVIENRSVCTAPPPTFERLALLCSVPSVTCTQFTGTAPTPLPI